MYITHCPRCGTGSLEHLTTHAYCWNCSYTPDYDPSLLDLTRFEFPSQWNWAHRGLFQ